MKRILILLAILILAGFAAGCATAPRTVADPRIAVDDSIDSLVKVLTVDYGETAGGNAVVTVSVRNAARSTCRIRYRTVWFDPQGNTFDSLVSVWKSATLDSGEIADLRAVSPRSDTKDFRFEIRRAK